MRLLTKAKIYRAYPELDKFDDEVCKQYVKHAMRARNIWKLILGVAVILILAEILWISVFAVFTIVMRNVSIPNDALAMLLGLTAFTGVIWFPAICALIYRDYWLRSCLRAQFVGTRCPSCSYSLLGLDIQDQSDSPTIQCPECGHSIVLADFGLTPQDIDPTLTNPE